MTLTYLLCCCRLLLLVRSFSQQLLCSHQLKVALHWHNLADILIFPTPPICRWQYTRVYLHSYSCCCLPNLRNFAKFSQNSDSYSSRSSKVIDLGVSRKSIHNFLLVISSKYGRIPYSCRDIDAFSIKIACFSHPTIVWRRLADERIAISTYSIYLWKVQLMGYNFVVHITGLSSFA